MILSYRTRKFFRGLATFLLLAALAAAVVWMVWIVWLDRFVVYTRDGAQFRFDSSAEDLRGEVAVPPEALPGVSIVYDDSDPEQSVSTELTQLKGYYADVEALTGDLAAVREQIEKLPTGTPVMVDVKTIYGYFLYNTDLGPTDSGMDTGGMDDLIAEMNDRGLYMIARVPALRDYYFGLNYTSNGLFRADGYALWNDFSSGRLTYWLDPTRDGTVTYMTQIANELKRMGFDEVVFSEFRFPDTTDMEFDGDKQEALRETADTVAAICATETFCVSFVSTDPSFVLPAGERCRLYLDGISAAQAQTAALSTGLEDPAIRVVFVTELGDTRYDEFGVLRPLSSAQSG